MGWPLRQIYIPGPVRAFAIVHFAMTACVLALWTLTMLGGHPSAEVVELLRVLGFPLGTAGYWLACNVHLGPVFHVVFIMAGLANSLLWGCMIGLPVWWAFR